MDSYAYTGLGMRLTKTDPTGTYSDIADGVSPASPVLSDGHTAFTPGVSETVGNGSGGFDSRFYVADAQGNSRGLVDGGQSVTDGYNWDGFGNLMSRIGSNPTAYGWGEESGYQSDNDGGLRLLGHRYYESRMGRFISADPAGSGSNWYAYCGNDPMDGSDPTGLVDSGAGTPPGGYNYPDGRPYTVEQDGSISMNGASFVMPNGSGSTSGDITGPADAGDFGLRGGVDDLATFGTWTAAGNAWGAVDSGHGSRAAAIGASALAGLAVLAFAGSDGEDAAAADGARAEAVGLEDLGKYLNENFLKESKDMAKGLEIKDYQRLLRQYGGKAKDWGKMKNYIMHPVDNLRQIEIHWYENLKTGMQYEFKSKL